MTREHKLAMVVGFGLLLFVGILVSDHFSTAQRQGPPDLVRSDPGRGRVTQPVSIAAVPPIAGVPALQPAESMATTTPKDVQTASTSQRLVSDTIVSNPSAQPIGNTPRVAPNKVIAVVEKSNAGKVQEGEPGVQLHPIAEGETLFSICAKTYGDGSLWKELAQYNKKTLPDAAKLRKGVTLRLPPIEQLRQGAVLASTTKSTRVSVTPQEQDNSLTLTNAIGVAKSNPEVPLLAAADMTPIAMSPITTSDMYVVQKGDTLGSIAKNKLGKSSKWKEIAAVNASLISNPAELAPGMNIKLPQSN